VSTGHWVIVIVLVLILLVLLGVIAV